MVETAAPCVAARSRTERSFGDSIVRILLYTPTSDTGGFGTNPIFIL